jgi:hypothetical protein
MELTTIVIEQGATPRLLMKHRNEIARQVGGQVGAHWQQYLLTKHWTTQATSEYGYSLRTARYIIRKRKKHGHSYPLMYTGQSMRALVGHDNPGQKASRPPNVRVTATGGNARIRVILAGAGNLNFKRSARSPDMRKEIITLSAADVSILSQVAATEQTRRTQALVDQSRITL